MLSAAARDSDDAAIAIFAAADARLRRGRLPMPPPSFPREAGYARQISRFAIISIFSSHDDFRFYEATSSSLRHFDIFIDLNIFISLRYFLRFLFSPLIFHIHFLHFRDCRRLADLRH